MGDNRKRVFMMMSGGVDSSVAAAVLVEQGFEVVGVFMKCWSVDQLGSLGVSRDLDGCFWEEDSRDARSVAAKLNIPFYVWNFEKEYKTQVVDYMLREYRAGRTPNPDVMCNSTIKFGIFYRQAMQLGADFVATGHYARRIEIKFEQENSVVSRLGIARGLDANKDQSYFVWRVHAEQLPRILFPIGEFTTKADVRRKAVELDLITATKPDSQGLCFIGQIPLRELLLQTLGEQPGNIVDLDGNILGQHPGAYLYTIGQRFGLGLSGGPWFVSEIQIEANVVVVAHQHHEDSLYHISLQATDLNWLGNKSDLHSPLKCEAQIRYRQTPTTCILTFQAPDILQVRFTQPVRAISKGQSIVFYRGDTLLGGGVIDRILE